MSAKKTIILTFLLCLCIMYLPLLEAFSQQVPLPEDIEITPPSSDLPKEIAAFSGKWDGVWDGTKGESILIVEEIDSKEAGIIYAWGEGLGGPPGWRRYPAKVIPGSKPKIEFGIKDKDVAIKFTFKMGKDLKSIKGMREFSNRFGSNYSSITMKKEAQ
jgi:hypothetical protein